MLDTAGAAQGPRCPAHGDSACARARQRMQLTGTRQRLYRQGQLCACGAC